MDCTEACTVQTEHDAGAEASCIEGEIYEQSITRTAKAGPERVV